MLVRKSILKLSMMNTPSIEVNLDSLVINWIASNLFSARTTINTSNGRKIITGILNSKGETVVPFSRYDYFSNANEGIIEVSKNNTYGFISTDGKEIVSPRYSYTGKFKNGFAEVAYNIMSNRKKGDGYINKLGKEFFIDDPERYVVKFKLTSHHQTCWSSSGNKNIHHIFSTWFHIYG